MPLFIQVIDLVIDSDNWLNEWLNYWLNYWVNYWLNDWFNYWLNYWLNFLLNFWPKSFFSLLISKNLTHHSPPPSQKRNPKKPPKIVSTFEKLQSMFNQLPFFSPSHPLIYVWNCRGQALDGQRKHWDALGNHLHTRVF